MDKRYELYCLVDNYFYDSASRLPAHPRDFELSHAPPPKGWTVSDRDNWHVFRPIGTDFPSRDGKSTSRHAWTTLRPSSPQSRTTASTGG